MGLGTCGGGFIGIGMIFISPLDALKRDVMQELCVAI
jgi:Lhr-like helicase